jgi:predicted kinase
MTQSIWKFPHYEIGLPIPWDKLEKEFSWFRDMKEVPQDLLWHGEGNVFIHTKMVVEALVAHYDFQKLSEQEKHIMFAVAMLHDVEKRSTTTVEDIDGSGRIVAPDHAKLGERTSRLILYKDIPTPFSIREEICKLVRYHGFPIWAIHDSDMDKKTIAVSLHANTQLLALFAKADILGRISEDKDEMIERVDMFQVLCEDNDCWGSPREFKSKLGRRYYFQRKESYPDFEPFDEKKFTAYVMCAVPGSGKDTYIEQNMAGIPVVSIDAIMRRDKVKHNNSKGKGRAIQEAKKLAKKYLAARESFVWNATNTTKEMRGKIISDFEEYGAKVEVIYVEVPYKTLLKQNSDRDYKVPEKVLNDMIDSLEMPDVTECFNVKYYVH